MSATLHGVNPRTGEPGPEIPESTADELDAVIAAAAQAAGDPRLAEAGRRAAMLRAAAARLRARRAEVVELAGGETGLPAARLDGELERTAVQLEMLGDVVAAGDHLEVIIDPADGEAGRVGTGSRPDVRRMLFPIGPVAVFGASNFPLAFSTAGGDTASALAAGCPVVVKGHPAHPRTGTLVARLLTEAAAEAGLPEGTFGHVLESGFALAERLVRDDRIEAVAFTGSFRGGRAIADHAANRARPIPVYAEMGSLNPLIVTEAALRTRAADIADGLAASVSTFGGQLCTKPGIALFPAGAEGDAFCELMGERLGAARPQVLLTKAIADGFAAGLAAVDAAPGVTRVGERPGDGDGSEIFAAAAPTAYRADAAALSAEALRDEHFGPAIILVAYSDASELLEALGSLGGQLAISIHSEPADEDWVRSILPACVAQAGRIVFDGFSTGVSVCWAMMHGGPYPASSDAAATSVGMTAIQRFLRPVAFQNAPDALLPAALRDDNPLGVRRRVDGVLD